MQILLHSLPIQFERFEHDIHPDPVTEFEAVYKRLFRTVNLHRNTIELMRFNTDLETRG